MVIEKERGEELRIGGLEERRVGGWQCHLELRNV